MLRKTLIGLVVLLAAAPAALAAPELSISERLHDRRYGVAGERARAIGFQDGRWYANGWHITGEMGGVWSEPLKLVDGVWFGVDDQWVGPATRFTSGWGYGTFDLPAAGGLRLERTDFVPDGRRAALFALRMTNPGSDARTVTVKVDAHSELMTEYPWGFTGVTPNAADNRPDSASFDGGTGALVFRDGDFTAMVASPTTPAAGETGMSPNEYRGPQGTNVCSAQEPPSACDDGPFGKGKGGQLRYEVSVGGGASETLWVAVAGSDEGLSDARRELGAALRDPEAALEAKVAARERWGRFTDLSLPGDRRLQRAVDWGKQNILDLTRVAEDMEIRWTNQGKQFPPPDGSVARARWVGAGFPDYPWLFATDGEYTAFASVAVGQFEAIQDHLIALRDISDILNDGSGVVAHEAVSDGSIWFGKDSRHTEPSGETKYDFNTDEIVKFPSAAALVWRWTGDNGFRDDLYDFSKRNLRYVVERLDEDGDGWPEGSGNVERGGMGVEKLDNSVYLIRGLYDLADMARSKRDGRTYAWARNRARRLHERFEATWWMPAQRQYADSIDTAPVGGPNDQQQDRHWIGVTPMEAELTIGEEPEPGLAARDSGAEALAVRETDCYSGMRPYNLGLFHTGCGGGETGQGELTIFGLNTAIQAVGEGNYGRLGPGRQQRYTDAEAEPMFGQPYTGGTPDEQPGALPEILPSPDFGANIDRCWTCRAMFVQAWGHYGTAWPVVHQQLGVRPDMGRRALEVTPQVPPGQPRVAGSHIRLGSGSIDVAAAREGSEYRTRVDVDVGVSRLVLGHTLPPGARVSSVTLDGEPAKYTVRRTNRGLEVLARVRGETGGRHVLVVRTD
ncbi:MAG: glycogen debranching protein [Thermoleophilaceae bacterium]